MDVNESNLKSFLEEKIIQGFEENDRRDYRDPLQKWVEDYNAGRASAFGDIYLAFYGMDAFIKFFHEYYRSKYDI